jgi:hypothetical protein
MESSLTRRSGVVKRIQQFALGHRVEGLLSSVADNELLGNAAGFPPHAASNWSFISEIEGETTSVRPPKYSAGS